MAKISLLQKVLNATELNLEFSGLSTQRTQEGELIAILQLSTPIENVRGSQEVEFQGRKIGLSATDVVEVKVHQNDFDGIEWDEATDTGSYKGSGLILDVSKGGQVWLRTESFAAGGQKLRRQNQEGRLATMLAGMGIKVGEEKKTGAPKIVADAEKTS